MKILITIPDFPPEVLGGTQLFTEDLAKNLAKTNEVVVITSGREKKIKKTGNLTILFVKKRLKNKILSNILRTFQLFFAGLSFSPDLVVGHLISSSAIAAFWLSKIKRIPLILRPGGFELESKKIYRKIFFYPILKRADGIIVMNPLMKKDILSEMKGKTIKILPQGISNINDKKVKRLKRGSSCLYVGRLVGEKNVGVIYDIAKKLPNIQFFIIGWGELFHKLEDNKTKNVHLLGRKTQKEVFDYMKKCGVFLLPSKKESFGRVIIEAMSFGMPILSTEESGGPKTMITNGVEGYLVKDCSNAYEYAQCLKKIFSNYDYFSDKSFERSKFYSWDNLIKRYEMFYSKLLRKNKGK